MKKTLVLTHEYFPFRGGVAYYIYNLFKFYPQDKYVVITDHPQVSTKENIINLKLKNNFIRPTWLFSFFKLKKIIKEQGIKQIFTPNILPLGSLAYFLKLPYIISLHGLDINLALKNKPKLTEKILRQAKLIIVNSLHTKQLLAPLSLPEDKIKLFYPSIDLSLDYDQARLEQLRKDLNIKTGEKVLLTVGRLNARKAHDLVIEAVAKLVDLPLKYIIVGRGEEQGKLEQLIKESKLTDKVSIINKVDDNNLIYYYRLADIFVLPNRQTATDVEGFGMVFLEAASTQLAIIAGNSGGVPELLQDNKNALLIEPMADNVATAIKKLIHDPSLATQLATNAKQRSLDFLPPEEQSKNLEKYL